MSPRIGEKISLLQKKNKKEIELKTYEKPRKEVENHVESDMISVHQELFQLSSMAIQLSLRQMVRQAMTITDSAFQGHIGTKQLAGVSLAGMWMGVPSAFIQFSIQAINTLCSQAYGAGNKQLVGMWLQTALAFAIVGSIPVIVWYFCVGYMIALTMDDEDTVSYGRHFAMVMSIGLIPQYIYGACSTFFASQGIIMPATICSALTMIMNVAFNQVFIYGAFGWKGLGFIGSPLATVTSTCLQLTLFLLYTIGWKKYHRECWGGWNRESLSPDRIRTFLQLAIPMGASAVVDWASATVAGAFSGFLGPQIAASQSVLGGVFGVANSAVSGFSTSTQIRMSRYLGKGSAMAAKRVLWLGGTIVLGGGTLMLCLVLIFQSKLFHIWSNDPVIIKMCTDTLLVFVICILVAFSRFLLTAVMNALSMADINLLANNIASWCIYARVERINGWNEYEWSYSRGKLSEFTKTPGKIYMGFTIVKSIRTNISIYSFHPCIYVPLSYLLPITLGWGLDGFWWADTLGELFKVIILLWGVVRVNWEESAEKARENADMNDYDAEEEEKRELCAYENEAMVARTPESYRIPSSMTPSTPYRMPKERNIMKKLPEKSEGSTQKRSLSMSYHDV